ncbi:hypothetical protein ACLUW3_01865 [Limosilactobacillus reuteri subsp. suis]
MTAEVGIINQRGIALAADSAITMGGSKVINSATKIFTLDSAHYVGIMIFGNADIMGIPWEVIIKSFREFVGNKTKGTVEDYVKSFLDYISSFEPLRLEQPQIQYVNCFSWELIKLIENQLRSNNVTNVEDAIQYLLQNYLPPKVRIHVSQKKFESKFGQYIKNMYEQNFNSIEYYKNYADLFLEAVYKFIIADYYSEQYTGVVIAGYGTKEYFPSIYRMNIDGLIEGQLKFSEPAIWNSSPIQNGGNSTPNIIPFAQTDVIFTLLTGISPELNELHEMQIGKIGRELSEYNETAVNSLIEKYKQQFNDYKQKEYIDPIINLLEGLSIKEMGEMAETLISLTSFKRKFSSDIGTVGGPTDVLTITRGEGPIWMKRKKYFDGEMNKGYELRRK